MGSVHFSSLIISRFSAQHSGSSALLLANLLVAVRRARTRVCCIPSAPSPIAGYASILPCLTPERERATGPPLILRRPPAHPTPSTITTIDPTLNQRISSLPLPLSVSTTSPHLTPLPPPLCLCLCLCLSTPPCSPPAASRLQLAPAPKVRNRSRNRHRVHLTDAYTVPSTSIHLPSCPSTPSPCLPPPTSRPTRPRLSPSPNSRAELLPRPMAM